MSEGLSALGSLMDFTWFLNTLLYKIYTIWVHELIAAQLHDKGTSETW